MEEIRQWSITTGGSCVQDANGEVVFTSDHKAVVETLEKDIEVSGKAVEDLIDLVEELKKENKEYLKEYQSIDILNTDLRISVQKMQNKIEELKCCGNCEHENKYADECIPCVRNENPVTDGDNWIAKGVK